LRILNYGRVLKESGNQWSETYGVKKDFVKVARALIDEVMPYLTPEAFTILIFIIRKTDGWQKCIDYISISQFQSCTGLSERKVYKALNELEEADIIFRQQTGRKLKIGLSRVGERPFKGEKINWDKLKQMKADRIEARRKQTKKARSQNSKFGDF